MICLLKYCWYWKHIKDKAFEYQLMKSYADYHVFSMLLNNFGVYFYRCFWSILFSCCSRSTLYCKEHTWGEHGGEVLVTLIPRKISSPSSWIQRTRVTNDLWVLWVMQQAWKSGNSQQYDKRISTWESSSKRSVRNDCSILPYVFTLDSFIYLFTYLLLF